MRTKEEITDLITEIDNNIGKVMEKEDIQYLGDVKVALKWVLNKISTGEETSKVEKNMKEITKLDIDELSDDDYKASMEFMNKEFEGHFKGRDPYDVYNVSDSFEWVLGETSTKQFLSSYLNLK